MKKNKRFEEFSYLKSTRFEKKTLAEAKLESFIEEKSKLFDDFFRYKMGILRYLPSFLLKKVKFCDFCQEVFTGHRICCSDVCFEMREKRDRMLRKNPQFSRDLGEI